MENQLKNSNPNGLETSRNFVKMAKWATVKPWKLVYCDEQYWHTLGWQLISEEGSYVRTQICFAFICFQVQLVEI